MIASEEVSDIFSGGRAYDVHVTASSAWSERRACRSDATW
jgi:hypothetical protein